MATAVDNRECLSVPATGNSLAIAGSDLEVFVESKSLSVCTIAVRSRVMPFLSLLLCGHTV